MQIVWSPIGRKVTVLMDGKDAVPLTWREPQFGEAKAFEFELERAAMTFTILEAARATYEQGRADYADAAKQVSHLLEESNKAGLEVVAACRKIGKWFDQPLSDLFDGRGNEFVRFCREWMDHVGHPKEVRKNSSRAPSEKSPKAPQKTAGTVNASLLVPTASPSGRAAKRKR